MFCEVKRGNVNKARTICLVSFIYGSFFSLLTIVACMFDPFDFKSEIFNYIFVFLLFFFFLRKCIFLDHRFSSLRVLTRACRKEGGFFSTGPSRKDLSFVFLKNTIKNKIAAVDTGLGIFRSKARELTFIEIAHSQIFNSRQLSPKLRYDEIRLRTWSSDNYQKFGSSPLKVHSLSFLV